MPQSILELLRSGTILLSDGAMGTELHNRGLQQGDCPEEFNLIRPEVVKGIHQDYFAAGSDLVETNTFGGNRARLERHGLSDKTADINKTAAELALSVRPAGKFVAGSVGPLGEVLEPLGSFSGDRAYEIFSEQIAALAEGGVDIIFIETMMALEEIAIAVRAAQDSTDLPVSATMTFEVGPTGPHTSWGVDPESAVKKLTEAGVDILGSNCGRGFDEMTVVVEKMRPLTDIFLLAQANAGTPILEEGKSVFKETPEEVVPKARKLLQSGVNILGGCCGTGPAHIQAMRRLVDAFVKE